MQEHSDAELLFDVATQIKDFYETAVVFVNKKDYSDILFKTSCAINDAIMKGDKSQMMELIIDFHLQWLRTVTDIETFRKRVDEDNFPKEAMYDAISFTMDALNYRMKHFQQYINNNRHISTPTEQANLQAEMEIVEEMHIDTVHSLLEKMDLFKNCKSERDYKNKVNEIADELLNWIDKANDCLSMKLCKYMNDPQLIIDLTKTLQHIVDELITAEKESPPQQVIADLREKGKEISTMIRFTTGHGLEMSKLYNKINILEDCIKSLKSHEKKNKVPSDALLALQNQQEYFLKRMNSLENLRLELKDFQKKTTGLEPPTEDGPVCVCEDFYQLRIFNYSLPLEDRERLVTELCGLWDRVLVSTPSEKSIISILNSGESKEEYKDELGTFYIDQHSRKIYKLSDDETLYQLNERNELVAVSDDADHVYYYDACGRYFIDTQTRQRVYKAYDAASEYMMDSTGVLLKIKEVRDGVTYFYDNYGRYYINQDGKHIYRDPDSMSEYENDGLGNLVLIRDDIDVLEPCPDDVHFTEDSKYLKQTVGKALRECISLVLINQPSDPIKYLSMSLIKFREQMEQVDRRTREKEELEVERQIILAEERAAAERAEMELALLMRGGSEATFDSNLIKYTPITEDFAESVEPSGK